MKKVLLCSALLFAFASTSQGAVTGLWNTGVDAGGVALGTAGAAEIHYYDPLNQYNYVTRAGLYPPASGTTAEWIHQPGLPPVIESQPDTLATYRLDISVTNTPGFSTMISGLWATDDTGTLALYRSSDDSLVANVAARTQSDFGGLTPFDVTIDTDGSYYLLFEVLNTIPTANGLLVDATASRDVAIPEPASVLVWGALGLLGLVGLKRRRSAK